MCFTVQLSRSLSCDSHIRLSHLFWLVKNFFHFLENLFFQDFQKFLRAPLSPTAMLEYHSVFPLSTSFLNLLKIIYFIFNLEYSDNYKLLNCTLLITLKAVSLAALIKRLSFSWHISLLSSDSLSL